MKNYRHILLFAAAMTALQVNAQDCNVISNAGPGIDVCTGGDVQLHGTFDGDVTHAEWRGGKGNFNPSRLSVEAEYTPTKEEAGSGVTLSFVVTPRNTACPEVKNDMVITVNENVKADAGMNQVACKGNVQMNGKVTGKVKSTQWVSNGTGKFNDASKLNAIYSPSEEDMEKGCSIKLIAEPLGVCVPDESVMALTFKGGISFSTEAQKSIHGGEQAILSIESSDKPGKVDWTSDGSGTFTKKSSKETIYNPSLEDIQSGSINLQVTVSDNSGTCSSKKDVVLVIGKGKAN